MALDLKQTRDIIVTKEDYIGIFYLDQNNER